MCEIKESSNGVVYFRKALHGLILRCVIECCLLSKSSAWLDSEVCNRKVLLNIKKHLKAEILIFVIILIDF